MGEAPINMLDPETIENPFPVYERLRVEAPVHYAPEVKMYVLTRYEDIERVVRAPELFTKGEDVQSQDAIVKHAESRALYEQRGWKRTMPLAENIPKHRPYRDLLDPILSTVAVRKREGFIRTTVNELIDSWIDRGAIEFMADFAIPLPVRVIGDYIGFPPSDGAQLKKWSSEFAVVFGPGVPLEREIEAVNAHIDLQHYIHDAMRERRRQPREDIISHLLVAEYDDPELGRKRKLTDVEIIGIVDHILAGGNESTAHALGNGLSLLFAHPEIHTRLQREPSKISAFVEEALRLESPTQGLFRFVTQDVEIGGVAIPQGSMLNIRFAAANRDPARFASPAMLDLDRAPTERHLAFSQGEHHCPGASLSRLEQNCAWEILLDRLSDIRPAPGKNDFRHAPSFILRGLQQLHIEFDKAPARG